MQFAIIGRPGDVFSLPVPPDDLQETLKAEWAKSREYYTAGILRQMWMLGGYKGALGIYEADSREHMEQINASYPMMQKGYAVHEIVELEHYPAFLGQ